MTTKICFFLLCTLITASPTWAQIFTQTPTRTDDGAVLGGVTGAIIGGIVGNQNDETIEGVAIGGVAGAVAGGLLGRSQDQQAARNFQFQQIQNQQQAQLINQSISISDAVALTRSGVSTNLMINQIRTNGVRQNIGVQEILYLHQNGVPEPVIQEMQRASIAGPPVATGPVIVDRGYIPPKPVVIAKPTIITKPAIIAQPSIIVRGPSYQRPPYYGRPGPKSRYHSAGRGGYGFQYNYRR